MAISAHQATITVLERGQESETNERSARDVSPHEERPPAVSSLYI